MPEQVNKKDYSLWSRLLWSLLPFSLLFFLLLSYALERSYSQSLIANTGEQLALQIRLLLADSEPNAENSIVPSRLQEPRLEKPDSQLFAFIIDQSGIPVWQSPSIDYSSNNFPEASKVAIIDKLKLRFLSLELGKSLSFRDDNGRFVTAMRVAFELDESDTLQLSKELTFVVIDSGKSYAMQMNEFQRTLRSGVLIAMVLLFFALLLILFGVFRPLNRLNKELQALESGKISCFEERYPREIKPLTDNLNQFVITERQQRERYRHTLADLAHSLKTPLSALRSSLEARDEECINRDILEQVDRMDQIVVHQLKRASFTGDKQNSLSKVECSEVIVRLTRALNKVYAEKNIELVLRLTASEVAVDEDDLLELLGNVIENAFKYCRKKVEIDCGQLDHSGNSYCQIMIADDGLGIHKQAREALMRRGVRADETTEGQGIGLAVTLEIIEAYGGRLDLGASEQYSSALGGALIKLSLPAFSKA